MESVYAAFGFLTGWPTVVRATVVDGDTEIDVTRGARQGKNVIDIRELVPEVLLDTMDDPSVHVECVVDRRRESLVVKGRAVIDPRFI